MSTPPGEYYTEERWRNWIDRIEAEEVDPENEGSARLLLNLQDDAAIAVAKIVNDFEDDVIDEDTAMDEIEGVREIVLDDVDLDDEEKTLLIDGVQTSLICVFYAAETFIVDGVADDGTVDEYIHAATDAETEEDLDAALGYCVQAGTLLMDDGDLDAESIGELDYGLVSEWVNGLDSLRTALSDPELVEADGDETN